MKDMTTLGAVNALFADAENNTSHPGRSRLESVPPLLDRLTHIQVKVGFFEDEHPDMIPNGLHDRARIDPVKAQGKNYRDNGKQIIAVNQVSVWNLCVELLAHGLALQDAFSYVKSERDLRNRDRQRIKRTVVFDFGKSADAPSKLMQDPIIQRLLKATWRDCFVWDNTLVSTMVQENPDRSVTINCRNPQSSPAVKELAIEDRELIHRNVR